MLCVVLCRICGVVNLLSIDVGSNHPGYGCARSHRLVVPEVDGCVYCRTVRSACAFWPLQLPLAHLSPSTASVFDIFTVGLEGDL